MQQSPKLIIIAGPNGSGKTTITHQILQHEWKEGCVYINPWALCISSVVK